jgi:hypothetical protein
MSNIQVQRVITVYTQRDQTAREIQTQVKTWGEFKEQNKREFDFTNMRGVVRHNKNILEVDDALLPEESFVMFLFPKKVKSGGTRTAAEYEKTFNSKELRKMCSERKLKTDGTKEDFAKRLAEADQAGNTQKPKVKAPIVHKEPASEMAVVVPSKESQLPVPASIYNVSATTFVTAKVQLNDVDALKTLLDNLFPGMEVVGINAVVDLQAELKLEINELMKAKTTTRPFAERPTGPAPKAAKPVVAEPVKEEVKAEPKVQSVPQPPVKEEPVATPVVKVKEPVAAAPVDKDQLAKEAKDWAKEFL